MASSAGNSGSQHDPRPVVPQSREEDMRALDPDYDDSDGELSEPSSEILEKLGDGTYASEDEDTGNVRAKKDKGKGIAKEKEDKGKGRAKEKEDKGKAKAKEPSGTPVQPAGIAGNEQYHPANLSPPPRETPVQPAGIADPANLSQPPRATPAQPAGIAGNEQYSPANLSQPPRETPARQTGTAGTEQNRPQREYTPNSCMICLGTHKGNAFCRCRGCSVQYHLNCITEWQRVSRVESLQDLRCNHW